jgi:hypothetical protein
VSVAGFEVTYVVGGREDENALERLVAAFERAGDELADFGKYAWPKLGPLLENTLKNQFDAEGEGTAGHWAPLSAQYAAWKAANYPGMPILQRIGTLYEGLTSSSSPFAAREQSGDDFTFGTRGVTYASYLQTGTRRMPARQPFDFGTSFETELSRIGAEAARESLKQAGVDEFMDLSALEHSP